MKQEVLAISASHAYPGENICIPEISTKLRIMEVLETNRSIYDFFIEGQTTEGINGIPQSTVKCRMRKKC